MTAIKKISLIGGVLALGLVLALIVGTSYFQGKLSICKQPPLAADNTVINQKGYDCVTGNLLQNVPFSFEIKYFDDAQHKFTVLIENSGSIKYKVSANSAEKTVGENQWVEIFPGGSVTVYPEAMSIFHFKHFDNCTYNGDCGEAADQKFIPSQYDQTAGFEKTSYSGKPGDMVFLKIELSEKLPAKTKLFSTLGVTTPGSESLFVPLIFESQTAIFKFTPTKSGSYEFKILDNDIVKAGDVDTAVLTASDDEKEPIGPSGNGGIQEQTINPGVIEEVKSISLENPSPADDAIDIAYEAGTAEIEAVFNNAPQGGSLKKGSEFQKIKMEERQSFFWNDVPEATASLKGINPTNKTVEISYPSLKPETLYRITVPAGAVTNYDETISNNATSWQFKTMASTGSEIHRITTSLSRSEIFEAGTYGHYSTTLRARFHDDFVTPTPVQVEVNFGTPEDTSEDGDYTKDPDADYITIPAGESEGEMTITLNQDDDADDEEVDIRVEMYPLNPEIDPSWLAEGFTIRDDDTAPIGDDDDDTTPVCGNDIVEDGELCDDANCDQASFCTSCKSGFSLTGGVCVTTSTTPVTPTPTTPVQTVSCLGLSLSKPEGDWNADDFTATNSQDFTLSVNTNPSGKASEFKYQWTVTGGNATDWKLGATTLDPSNTLQNIDTAKLTNIKVVALNKTTGAEISACSLTKTFATDIKKDGYTDLDDIDDQELLDAIEWVTEQGIFEGYEDGTFKPFQKIDRVELLKVLLAAYDVPEEDAKLRYKDIDEDEWYIQDLKTGLKTGVFEGDDGKNTARPNDSVNRVEALKMTLEVANIVTGHKPKVCRSIGYDDVYDDQWYYKYTCESYKYGLFDETDDDELSPGRKATRGELALLIYRLYKEGFLDEVID